MPEPITEHIAMLARPRHYETVSAELWAAGRYRDYLWKLLGEVAGLYVRPIFWCADHGVQWDGEIAPGILPTAMPIPPDLKAAVAAANEDVVRLQQELVAAYDRHKAGW